MEQSEIALLQADETKRQELKEAFLNNLAGLFAFIGDNPNREGLLDTPKRIWNTYQEFFKGYDQDPAVVLSRVFKDGATDYDQMIVLTDIDFVSWCEHHMLPFVGVAHIAYIPDPSVGIVGVSKLARLVDIFASRLQVQEKMTAEIAKAIEQHVKPEGCAVLVSGHHMCMGIRGVRKSNTRMITHKVCGCFQAPHCKNEFLQLVQMHSRGSNGCGTAM